MKRTIIEGLQKPTWVVPVIKNGRNWGRLPENISNPFAPQIDWAKVWKEFDKWTNAMPMLEIAKSGRKYFESLVNAQLRGGER